MMLLPLADASNADPGLLFLTVLLFTSTGGCIAGCWVVDRFIGKFYSKDAYDRSSPIILAIVICITLAFVYGVFTGFFLRGTGLEILAKFVSVYVASIAAVAAAIWYGTHKSEPTNFLKLLIVSTLATVIFLVFIVFPLLLVVAF